MRTELRKLPLYLGMFVEVVACSPDPLVEGDDSIEVLSNRDFLRLLKQVALDTPPRESIRFARADALRELERRESTGGDLRDIVHGVIEAEHRLVLAQWLGSDGPARAYRFQSTEDARDEVIVAPDPSICGGWRMTSLDDRGPSGHYEFESLEQALLAVSGAWIEGRGPPFARRGLWRLVERGQPHHVLPMEDPADAGIGVAAAISGHGL